MTVLLNRKNGLFAFLVVFLVLFSGAVDARSVPRLEAIRTADYVNHTHICLEIDRQITRAEVIPISKGSAPVLVVKLYRVSKGPFAAEHRVDSEFLDKIAIKYRTSEKALVLTIPCDPNIDLDRLFWHRWNDMVTIDLPLKQPNYTHVPPLDYIQAHKEQGYKVVVIDPGHGGFNSGGKGYQKYLKATPMVEKDVVFDLAKRLKKFFDQDPRILTIMTRYGDYLPVPFGLKGKYRHNTRRQEESYQDVALGHRVALAKQYCGDIYLSLHLNAPPPPNTYSRHRRIRGYEIYFLGDHHAENLLQNPDTEEFASYGIDNKDEELTDLLSALMKEDIPQRSKKLAAGITTKVKEISWMKLRDPVMKSKRYKVLRQLHMPSVLIEFMFVTNPTEHRLLQSAHNRNQLVSAVYDGVQAFLFDAPIPIPEAIVRSMETGPKPKTGSRSSVSRKTLYHTVRRNETLGIIAKKYKVSLSNLKRSNRSKIGRRNLIHPGDVLLIPQKGRTITPSAPAKKKSPASGGKIISYTVRRGDNLGKIARRHGTTPEAIMILNHLKSILIHPGEKLKVPDKRTYVAASRATPKKHKVRSGETLGKIAGRYHTSVRTLQRLNGIRGSIIHPGQPLTLPLP